MEFKESKGFVVVGARRPEKCDMPRQLALFICALFILWLFSRDAKVRPMASWALWVPLVWFLIIGTRSVSIWFGQGYEIENPEDYVEGSALDRNVFFFLVAAGFVVLLRRKVDWVGIAKSNRWVFAFFIYCGISALWSDYSFVAIKRWIKDLGNVIMVLIVLTEGDPVGATRAIISRYTYFAIPLSVVFIKYFPELGRYYNRWTWEVANCGVAGEKNALGCIALICGLFLIWSLSEMSTSRSKKIDKANLLCHGVLLIMVIWLIDKADSSTALVCLILGAGILLLMGRTALMSQVRHLGTYTLVVGFSMLLLYSTAGVREGFVELVGRTTTLTGRTDLWAELLNEPINPLVGTGYQSFWFGPRAKHYWEVYSFRPNQAHNGYLETYLNGGLVGVCLLFAMVVSAGNRLKREILSRSSYAIFLLALLTVAVVYNWTEAVFNKMSPIWFVSLIALVDYPGSPGSIVQDMTTGGDNND